MEEEKYQNLKLGERGVIISIMAYLVLSALKLFIGYISDSQALKADGLNNTTDIIASAAVLVGLKLSRRPADRNHPYGHWRSETVASMVASFIMMAVGIQVLYAAGRSVFEGSHVPPDLIAAWTGLFSAAVMFFVYRNNKKISIKINSGSVMAAAKDNISDAWVSIGTAIGIIGSQFGLTWLDPAAAFIVGILICKTAWDIFRDASLALTDGYDEMLLEAYKKTTLDVHGVKGVKDIRARQYGSNSVVDIVILVKPDLELKDAHDISTIVEKELKYKHDVYNVHVHVEPN
ncbi:cation diffusion facilitator family transporter [Peribacillus sp. SCS-26]|uniref:cation diffusion facilitator family transporter n=1 Tax=Paraperibacillus marinus TaxID=3115295 RepID=UPI003905C007